MPNIISYIRQYDSLRESKLAEKAESLAGEGYTAEEICMLLGIC